MYLYYKMQHIIYDKNKTLSLPENITEITGTHLVFMAAVLNSGLPKPNAALKMLRILSGLGIWQWWRLPAAVKLQLLDYVQWTFDDFKLCKQLLPCYKSFYGPKDELDNLTLSEFYFAERFYADHINGDANAINKLVAVLYRKGKLFYNKTRDKDGDIRQPFNANLVHFYSCIIDDWPAPVKQAIILFYDGCRAKLTENYPKIFSSHNTDANNNADMFGILRGLSGGKYGDLEKVEKMYLHTALLEMNFVIEENEEMERQMKKTG